MEKREFDLGLMLSLTDGHLMTEFPKVQEAIEWLVGYPVWTHQLPRVFDIVKPYLEEKFPKFKGWAVPDGLKTEDSVKMYLWVLVALYDFPETYTVEKMPPTEQVNPLVEMGDILAKNRKDKDG